MRQDAKLTALFPSPAVTSDPEPPEPRATLRNLGRAMLYFSVFFLLLGSYMELSGYWIRSHWIRADARVLSVKVYESVDRVGRRGNKQSYGSRYDVSYMVAGARRQSEFDSGAAFANSEDAASYAARVTAGRRISIFYKPSDPSVARLDGAPAPTYATASQMLQLAGFFFLAAVLVKLALRQELPHDAA